MNSTKKNVFGWGFFVLFTILLGLIYFIYKDFLHFQKLFLFTDIGSDTLNWAFPKMVHDQRYGSETGFPINWSFYVGLGKDLFQGWRWQITDIISFLLNEQLLGPDFLPKRIAYIEAGKLLLIGIATFWICRLRGFRPYLAIIGGLCMALSA